MLAHELWSSSDLMSSTRFRRLAWRILAVSSRFAGTDLADFEHCA